MRTNTSHQSPQAPDTDEVTAVVDELEELGSMEELITGGELEEHVPGGEGGAGDALDLGAGTSRTSLCTATTFSSILDLQTLGSSWLFFLLNFTVTLRTRFLSSGWTSVTLAGV